MLPRWTPGKILEALTALRASRRVLRWCDAPDALAVASLSEQSHEEPQASEKADVGRCCPRGPKGLRSVADPSPDPPQTRPLSLAGAQTDPWL